MTARRWLLPAAGVVGVGVGVLGALGVLRLDQILSVYPETDPGASTWSCDGAEVLATAALDDGRVSVTVTVRSDRQRTWEVQWDDGAYAVLRTRDDLVSSAVTARTGDLDDGPSRDVAVRPVGRDGWCHGTVSLT